MNEFELSVGYTAGIIGRITELHADYYSKNWGFGKYFEAKVASELSDFIVAYDDRKDRIFSLLVDGKVEGSVSIDGSSENNNVAHLRWFVMSDRLRGKGAGNYLLQQSLGFCKECEYDGVYLWTFQGLNSARHLYEKNGFVLTSESTGTQWGTVVNEQRFDASPVVLCDT